MKLELYYKPECPFCKKVIQFMERRDIKLEMKNIHEKENLDKLIEVGGMNQVPCLFIDGKAIYESDDIIQFLKDNADDK
ncbi:MAG: glutaredoxin [Firmicutes bacterium]|nr:glutaredoxin [Ezakiella sp.]MDD7761676.1 glutaredoxin [Bacillota bacterium]